MHIILKKYLWGAFLYIQKYLFFLRIYFNKDFSKLNLWFDLQGVFLFSLYNFFFKYFCINIFDTGCEYFDIYDHYFFFSFSPQQSEF